VNNCPEYVLLLSCPDARGIVHAVTGFLVGLDGAVVDSQQYGDAATGIFCMRIQFSLPGPTDVGLVRDQFAEVAVRYAMEWKLYDLEAKPRVLIMVSHHDHCLHDLLYRWRRATLQVEVVGVVSNHRNTQSLVESFGVPFHYLIVTAETKKLQERTLLRLIERERVDLVVLARYMQVFTDELCRRLEGRVINIHHEFLASISGPKPYQQAYERGVKLIGATAHYVTPELDDGPIIEQDIARVSHGMTAEQLNEVGREIETRVLSRAVQYEVEHRVLLIGRRTVVFAPY
jgi:formyltetrahydrofolate deformylase